MPSASAGEHHRELDGPGRAERVDVERRGARTGRSSTQRSHSGRKASVASISMNVAKASLSQMPFHHFMVTRSPNHMWAISWAMTSATRWQLGLGGGVGVDQQQRSRGR